MATTRKPAPARSPVRVKRGANKAVPPEAVRTRGRDTGLVATAALVDENKPLTDMQRVFVKAWASGETILSASVRAGYADGGSFAYRMAHMPNILKLYNAEKKAFEEASNMSRKRVIDGILEAIADAKLLQEPSSQIAGWREIGKLCGYFEPVRVQHQVTVEGKVLVERMNRMSDEDLFKMIESSAAAITAQVEQAEDGDPSITDVNPK